MKSRISHLNAHIGLLTTVLLALGATAWAADPTTLKDAFKDYFHVGVAINRTIATGAAVRADNVNRTRDQVEQDIALVKDQFNQVAPENDLKWALIHPREGADGYHFGPADAFVNFGLSNNMYLVGHTLVWHAQTPNWVFAGTNPPPEVTQAAPLPVADTNAVGTNAAGRRGFGRGFGGGFGRGFTGPRASREELLARMRDHIHTVVGRYKGKIKVWDVVNEAIADGGTNVLRNSLWLQIIGPDFIARAFEYAHEADPDAILRYNDYGLENPAKRRKLITLIKSLQEQHVPVMAIGSQTHVSVSSPSFEAEDAALTELEQLGLPIHITELDVNSARGGQRDTGADVANNAASTQGGLIDDANQGLANQYASLFRAFLKHRNSVKVVTFWGVNDGVSWRARGRPLLFDANNRPKPAFDAVIAEASAETRRTGNPARRAGTGGFGFGAPAPLPAGVKAERDIPYVENGHLNQVLDLFLPEQRSDKPLPLMIWIHGGAWIAGSQANPPVLYLLSKGFAVASIQHRFSSDALWPAQSYDCKAAIRFLRANAAKYNFDPDHFGVGGDSSGGHLAAFVGTSGDVQELEGDLGNTNVSSRVQAVVDWFGPTDLTLMAQQSGTRSMIHHDGPHSPESRLLGGPVQEKRDLAKTANPLTYVDKDDPPFLIMHGDNDQLVPLGQSVILAKALIDAGVEVTMKTIAGAAHEGPQFHTAESQRLIEEFLSRKLKANQ